MLMHGERERRKKREKVEGGGGWNRIRVEVSRGWRGSNNTTIAVIGALIKPSYISNQP